MHKSEEKMKKIRVVIVIPALVFGGAENMVCQLSKAINRDKFDLTLVSIRSKQNTPFEQILADAGVEMIFLNNTGKPSVKTAIDLWRLLNKYNPDIIHSHLSAPIYAIPWLYTRNRVLLHTIHNTPKFEFSTRIIHLMRKVYRKKKAVPVAISNKIKLDTSELYDLSLDKIEVIYNPVDTDRFSKKLINPDKSITFITVGRFVPQKNQKLLIQAFANVKKELPYASLKFVGDGELRSELEALVSNLNLKDSVTFTGNIANVEDHLGTSDIFVLTSHYEGLPLSILEAMAAGLPIISTNVGGVVDIVHDNGILCKDNDLQGITNAMLKVAKNKELRKDMSTISIELSKQYDIANIAHEYEMLYEKYSS